MDIVKKHGPESKRPVERVMQTPLKDGIKVESKHEGGSIETKVEVGTPSTPRTSIDDVRHV